MHFLDSICTWLAATALSQTLKSVTWVIPAVQTVHILAVATVMTSVLMVNLRLLGIGARERAMSEIASRFYPFLWWPLPVLLATGLTLIAAEPPRELKSPVFLLKMALLAGAAGITLVCQVPLQRQAQYWELSAGRRRAVRVLGIAALLLWIAIVFAGRWIAYVPGS